MEANVVIDRLGEAAGIKNLAANLVRDKDRVAFQIRMPRYMHQELGEVSDKLGVSMNDLILVFIKGGLLSDDE